jgi:mannose-6-phosphate isomerase-like protein (cupin superfamily)
MTKPANEILRQSGDGRPFTVGPSRVEVKVEGTETDGRFSMIQWEFPPGAPAPPQHIHHDASETFYVIEGELEFPLGDRVVQVGPGCSLHIPAGTAHTISNPGAVLARALEIFCPGSLMGLVEEMGRIFSDGFPPDQKRVQAAFQKFNSSLAN